MPFLLDLIGRLNQGEVFPHITQSHAMKGFEGQHQHFELDPIKLATNTADEKKNTSLLPLLHFAITEIYGYSSETA